MARTKAGSAKTTPTHAQRKPSIRKSAKSAAKPSNGADIAPVRYPDSLGAKAMHDTLHNTAERNHYNYVDVEFRDKAFEVLDTADLVSLKHQSAVLLYGMHVWERLSKHHVETGKLIATLKNKYDHPYWKCVFRHARNGNERVVADQFLSSCLGIEGAPENFDWFSTPEHIRIEWVLYNWRNVPGIAPQLADIDTLKAWFPSEVYQHMAIFGLAESAMVAGDMSALGHYLELLEAVDPDTYALRQNVRLPDAFLTVRLRETHIRFTQSQTLSAAYLAGAWPALEALGEKTNSPTAFLMRMQDIYKTRIKRGEEASDSDAINAAHEDWKALLENALLKYKRGDMV